MKKIILSALTAACILALTAGLHAQDGTIVAHVDQEFVAAGRTFPAGTYRFVPDLPQSQLVTIRSNDGKDGAIVLPMIFESATPANLQISFQQIDGVYYLSEVATPLGVYTLTPPRASTKLAKAKSQGAMSSSGTN